MDFIEQLVESIELNGTAIDVAKVGDRIGIRTVLAKGKVKIGMKIFKIIYAKD